jgi:hypothetical protein
MASKKNDASGPARGARLVKKAIEAGKAAALSSPEALPAGILKKLTLPNGEPISPSMKELLKFDATWLGIEFDEDEGDIEAASLEELVEDEFGDDAVGQFAEAYEVLGGDCVRLGADAEGLSFLYVGEADETGEYAVVTATAEPKAWVGGFVPFDVWVAQKLGALEAPRAPGAVPPEYEPFVKALAEANGDGRTGFEPKAGDVARDDDEGDEDDGDES